jgi:hypothetical protein
MKQGLILIAAILFSCNGNDKPMDEFEQHLANKVNAEHVTASQKHTEEKTNGKITSTRDFLHIELDNPQYLVGVKHNQRVFKKECENLANYLMDSVQWKTIDFNEIQIDVIEQNPSDS